VQLDEVAFPVLLAAALDERDALGGVQIEDMVRRALGFIALTGPATSQDRWEENDGINTFTLAVSIAALVTAEACCRSRPDIGRSILRISGMPTSSNGRRSETPRSPGNMMSTATTFASRRGRF
jgi:hypothetical protein